MSKNNGKKPKETKESREFESIRERIAEIDEEILFADGFEDALIGVVEGWFAPSKGKGASHGHVALYDLDKCIKILMDRDGMKYDDACEFLSFNTLGAYHGERTPVFATIMRKGYTPKEPPAKSK